MKRIKKFIKQLIDRIKSFFIITYKFIKRKKVFFIVIICALLFILGLVRDIKKNNKEDNDNKSNNTKITEYKESCDIKIIGGVNKDYSGQIEKGLMLYQVIDKYCNGLSNNASIDNINLVYSINNDYELIIKEANTIYDNTFYIEDYSTINNKEYRYSGRVDGRLVIYIVNEGISEEDYKLITKASDIEIGSSLVNINTATLQELIDIGLGKSKSEKLIEYREKNGPFLNIEDITKVSGIGEATLEKVKDKICAK